MRLADEARKWVSRCDDLAEYADEDGIVCLSATRGEGGRVLRDIDRILEIAAEQGGT